MEISWKDSDVCRWMIFRPARDTWGSVAVLCFDYLSIETMNFIPLEEKKKAEDRENGRKSWREEETKGNHPNHSRHGFSGF